ncbi:MAG: hypothetical protein KatS3mg092_0215 [Patescibacteria group bacterium]|nr:MAG: hypothetical protein KatS3mg092_0215 [Patescibacteria group bacterium]
MKKNTVLFLMFLLVFSYCVQVRADEEKEVKNFPIKIYRQEIKPTIKAIKDEVKPTIKTIREETKEKIKLRISASPSAFPKEIKKEIREEKKGFLDQIKNQVKEKLQALKQAKVIGKITEIGNNYLKITDKEGKAYQVNITEKTQLRRHFWGKASLNEFSVGDEVNVIGRYTDETKTVIEAVLIRNNSIQKRWGAFFGEVISKNSDNFVIKTLNRGEITVYFGNAKFVDNDNKTLTYADLKVGQRVRVKGVWDKTLSKLMEVEEVKVYNLKKTLSPTPQPTE